jgi:hypothetical protein
MRGCHRRWGEVAFWLLGLILMVLLVIGGVELNPGHPAHMRNQEC